MEAPHVSPPCHVWCPLVYWKWRYNIFNLSRELTRTRNWRIVWRYGSKLVNYITTLPNLLAICEVVLEIWWLYFITWSCKTIWLKSHVILREVFSQAKSPSGAKFRSHKPCGRGNIVVLVCHVISQDHTMKKSAPRHYRRWGGLSAHTRKENVTIWVGAPDGQSPPWQVW